MNRRIPDFLSLVLFAGIIFAGRNLSAADVTIIDSRHYSNVFGEERNFRIFLPPGYSDNPMKRYPVIYFYHGWSQRYFGSGPDSYSGFEKGDDNNGDNIANFVAGHDVIVVKPDGYNRSPGEEYYLRPYNIGPVETYRQFPLYFPELVSFIDGNYRTIPDRGHRAISGLSMGGFMSYWIGGKYPQLICAIGNFCGSAEFIAGPRDFPSEYRHIDMYKNYDGIKVRLNYGNEDFIRYYHRDLNRIWTQLMDNYEYKVYPAAHSTCGMGEMFSFLMKAFDNPPGKPARWNHTDVYPEFRVWDYEVSSDRDVTGFTVLENVDSRGFRCSVRDHMPDGGFLPFVRVTVTTGPVYDPETGYLISDIDLKTMKSVSYELRSDNAGRLKISLNGSMHEIGINRTGDLPNITVASFEAGADNIAECNKDVAIGINLLNKGGKKAAGIRVTLEATRKSATVIRGEATCGAIDPNSTASPAVPLVFHVGSDTIEVERFRLTITDKDKNQWVEFLDIPLVSGDLPELKDYEIADGKVATVAKEGIHEETVFLGRGNGEGVANPGESVVILAREGGKLWRTSLTSASRFINPDGINTRFSDNWGSYDHVGGSAKYSMPLISSECPENQVINFIGEYWLPDSPNHIIKKCKVSLRVSGKDKTPPEVIWVRVTGDNVVQALVSDGSPVSRVSARLISKASPDSFLEYGLKDDGTSGDRTGADNVFSFQVPEHRFGMYTIEVAAWDSYGNQTVWTAPGTFILH